MNINFNQIIKVFTPFLILFLIAYLLTSILYIYLPKKPKINIEQVSYNVEYAKYKLYKNFQEKSVKKKTKPKKKIQAEYKLISNIILKAIYSTQSNGGWIIISENSSSKTYILSIGDTFKNYKLKLIYNNYVIFTKDNKEYKLAIKADNKKANYTIKNIENETPINNQITQSDNEFTIERKLINNYSQNISKIWKEINIQDYKIDGKLNGFKIRSIASKSIFHSLGLKKGDIIKKVNNIDLKSYSNAFSIYKKLNNTTNLNFTILRNNEEVELEYEIK